MNTFTSIVRDLTFRGLGVIDHPDGRVFFAPGCVVGDRAEFVVTSIEKKYGYAKLHRMLEPSSDRVEPICPLHGFDNDHCNGCPWQMMSYKRQLIEKEKILRYHLSRHKIANEKTRVDPIWAAPHPFGYRNRAQFKTNGEKLGFVNADTETIVDVPGCPILNQTTAQHLKTLRSFLPYSAWTPADGHSWNFIDIDLDLPPFKNPEQYQLNLKRPFRQGNDEQNKRMQSWVFSQMDELSAKFGSLSIIELFCGSGNFTQVMARHERVSKIIGVDASIEATQELQKLNHPKITAIAKNIFRMGPLNELTKLGREANILFLDPPRSGFRKLSTYAHELKNLRAVIYVSCDLSSFCYDAKMLCGEGYVLHSVRPLDMFPQTPHVEVMSLFLKTS